MSEHPRFSNRYAYVVRICLPILTTLALAYTAYLAQDILLLLLVTGLVSLLLAPGVKLLEKIYVPRVIGAALLICLLVVPTTAFMVQLQEPVTKWAKMLPELSEHVSQQIEEIDNAIESATKTTPKKEQSSWFSWFDSEEEEIQKDDEDTNVIKSRIKETLFSAASSVLVWAPSMLVQFLTMLVLILFTLVYSPKLFNHYVELFVVEGKRKSMRSFALSAQSQLSRYILTVSAMNFLLGLSSVIFLYAIGFNDALLLGTVMGLLNFIPYVGPLIALGLIAIGGLVQWGVDLNVLLAVGGVVLFNVLESQFLTPLSLAKNLRINPFIIVLCLLLSGWMWGLIGLLIAVPLMVCVKLVLSQFKSTQAWVDFIAT